MFGKMQTSGKTTKVFSSQGAKFTVDSGCYKAQIEGVYAFPSGNGEGVKAILEFKLDKGDGSTRTYKEEVHLVNKEGSSVYTDSSTGAEILLPGASLLAEICAITCRQSPENMETEETMIEIYDFQAGGKKPKQVTCLPDLKGKEIELCILESEVFKQKKVGNEYIELTETRFQNAIELVLQPETHKTLKELQNKVEQPLAHDTWLGLWEGKAKPPVSKKGKGKGKNKTPKVDKEVASQASESFKF